MAAAKARVDACYGNRDCETVADYRELCGRSDIDAVMIAVPNHAHARIGVCATQQGKDVFGEIPFAHTRAEGEALLREVSRRACVWQSGSWQRSCPEFRKAVAAVRAGRIGRISRVEVGVPGGGRGPVWSGFTTSCPPSLDWSAWQGETSDRAYPGFNEFHWRWVSVWGGGILGDWMGHHGDVALWGAGCSAAPEWVRGEGNYPVDGLYDTATSFHFTARYPGGMEVTVADGGRLEMGVGVRWIGADGTWIWVTRGSLQASDPRLFEELDLGGLGASVGLHRNFVDCVKSRQATLAPADAAYRASLLGQLGEAAMRAGGSVSVCRV
jgi:predicted dehydrogenase